MPIDRNDILEAGRAEMADNPDRYDGGEDLEALGTAAYLEESLEPDSNHDISDVADFIASEDDFDFGEFIEYKKNMGNDYSHFADPVGRVFDEVNELQNRTEAMGGIYEALYEEAKAERDSAATALEDILDSAGRAKTSSDWPDQNQPDDGTGRDVGSRDRPGFWNPQGSMWSAGRMGTYQSQTSNWNGLYQESWTNQGQYNQWENQWGFNDWFFDPNAYGFEDQYQGFDDGVEIDVEDESDGEEEIDVDIAGDESYDESEENFEDQEENYEDEGLESEDLENEFDYSGGQELGGATQNFNFSGSNVSISGSVTMEQSVGDENQYFEASF